MTSMGTAVAYLELDTSKYTKSFADAKKQFDTFNKSASNSLNVFGKSLTSVGKSLTTYVTLPIIGAGAAATTLAASFETGMRKVSTIADTSVKSIEQLGDEVLQLSSDLNIDTTQLNEALYQTLSATNDTANAMAYLEVAGKLAKGGFTDITTAVDGATSVMNAYGLEGEEAFQKIADIMITTQNLGKTTVDELARSLYQVIPTASALGVNFEQIAAAMASMTAQGTPTSVATTQLNALLVELAKSSTDVGKSLIEKTGKGFQELIEEGNSLTDIIGLLTSDFENWDEVLAIANEALESGAGGVKTFDEALQYALGSIPEAEQSLIDMFGSIEAAKAALQLAGENVEAFESNLEAMSDSAGATQEAFETMAGSSTEAFSSLINELKIVGIQLGEILLPYVIEVVTWVKNLVESFKALDEGTKTNIVTIAAVVASIGPLIAGLGQLISLISSVKTLVPLVAAAGKALVGVIGAIGAPVAAVVAAIIAAVLLLKVAWENNLLGIQEVFAVFWENFMVLVQAYIDWLLSIWGALKALFSGDIQGFFEGLLLIFQNFWTLLFEWLNLFIDTLIMIIVNVGVRLYETGKQIFEELKVGIQEKWEEIKAWLELVKEDPVKAFTQLGTALYNAGLNAFNQLLAGLQAAWEAITSWLNGAIEWLISKVSFAQSEAGKVSAAIGASGGSSGGSYRSGLDYVPYDGFNATLHQGERVLTAEENRVYGAQTSGDTYNFYSPEVIDPIVARREMKKAKQELATII